MIEKKFEEFRDSITKEEFNNIDFLKIKVDELEFLDPELSKRINIRVKNLKNHKEFNFFKNNLSEEQWNNLDYLKLKKNNQKNEFIIKKIDERIELLTTLLPSNKQEEAINERIDSTEITNYRLVLKNCFKYPFIILVIIPTIIFSLYQLIIASDRYQSEAKVIVQQPDTTTTLDTSMALLSGLGVGSASGTDPEILKTYIYSTDMLEFLDEKIHLRDHYTNQSIDIFSRLIKDDKESFLTYYQKHISVDIDSNSGILSIYAQGFSSIFSNLLVKTIVKRSEWYINSIGHQLAEAQLDFVKQEQKNIEEKLKLAQSHLLKFQQKYNLLDPTVEGVALQKIAYTLEGQITAKEAELKTARHIMSDNAPKVLTLKQEISGLKMQLENERNKLATRGKEDKYSVGDILAKYADLKVDNELALKAYTSSQVSLEKSRIETYRQLKYLVIVENPTLPDNNKYPEIPYNIVLFFIILAMGYGVGRIIFLTIKEIK
ncbi:lipopolysaccharide biosynthesis protein [Vibrio sp. NFV-1]|uniref:Lipopolysaccharide biosynthesis protein n=1 Tax=Vibrio nitrifigilis TaxID=2789781 RepID=A0ABS0GFL3_9VIBR|nr:lipopolysaccharide biosynthesis protein [Vibrio nitrifigilis]